MNYTLEITGMTCNHCRMRVKKALAALPSVAAVSVDLASGRAEVSSEGMLDPETLLTTVTSEGYEAVLASTN